VRLDGALADDELLGDLPVRAPACDEPGDLVLAGGQRARPAGPGCAMVAPAEPAHLPDRGVAVAVRPEGVEVAGGPVELGQPGGEVAATGQAQSVLVTRPSGPAYLSLAEGILALLSAGEVPPDRAAWAVDLLLHFATSTAAEQGTRHRAAGADDEEDALAAALLEAPADTFPHIAALGAELMSGAGPDRLIWGFRVLISGITQTPRPEEPEPRGNPEPPGT
jgi:hypothetical protein